LQGSSSITGNNATSGGGIYNRGTVTLQGSSSITGNNATSGGGGIYNYNYDGTVRACNSSGVNEWTGAISPNTPDDPPTITSITCS